MNHNPLVENHAVIESLLLVVGMIFYRLLGGLLNYNSLRNRVMMKTPPFSLKPESGGRGRFFTFFMSFIVCTIVMHIAFIPVFRAFLENMYPFFIAIVPQFCDDAML